jgi:hypothetical protein
VTFSDSPADYVDVSYDSNLSECTLITNPSIPVTNSGSLNFPPDPQGLIALAPAQSGSYQISMKCDGAPNYNITSTPLTLTVLAPPPPTEKISFAPGKTVAVQEPFTISWSSTNAQDCTETGVIAGQSDWGGNVGMDQPPTGQVNLFAPTAGQYTLGLTCQSIDPNTAATSTSAVLNVVNLTATLSAAPTTVTAGSSFTLTWSSTGASSCTASGGGANGVPWSGSLAASGTVTQIATLIGTFFYTVDCPLNNEFATAQVGVTVSAPASSSGSAGGKGGGGALGFLELAALAGLLAWRVCLRGYLPRQLA